MIKSDWSRINPFLISVEFDPNPEYFEDGKWAITASVDIGDRLLLPYVSSLRNRLFREVPKTGSISGDFVYLVCSPEFKTDPNLEYNVDPRYLHAAYTQVNFDKEDAIKHLRSLIDDMGEVSIEQFTDNIHEFLETDEWDYLMQAEV